MAARQRNNGGDPNLQPLINSAINAFFRLSPRNQFVVIVLLGVLGLVGYFAYRNLPHAPLGPDGSNSADLVLGNPSNAQPTESDPDNFLLVKPHYVLSYNNSKGIPNWVSWCVTEADLGTAPRKDEFDEDRDLPSDFYRVTQHDYTGSGFDRGHMCPHSDRAATIDMSYSTFVMSNIIPQAPNVNRKAWAQMENYCRDLVRHHDRLYIIAGPAGQGGQGSNRPRDTIGQGRVVVPAACWKIVVDLPDTGVADASTITANTRVLSVEMPNDQTRVDDEWAQYRVTPAQIEQQTGLHFFTKLNPQVAEKLRQKLDQTPLPRPIPLEH